MPKNHRRCVSCRRVAEKSEFWRVVAVHHSQHIQLDVGMGRSAYLCPTNDCLVAAQKKNRLGRALKTATTAEIYPLLASRLRKEENGL
jgi:uncharacterized protein